MAERLKIGRQWKKDTFSKKAIISWHFDFLGITRADLTIEGRDCIVVVDPITPLGVAWW